MEIDLWATANRFKAGHRLRVDISSADFPHFDRNSNRGGVSCDSIPAHQSVYHDPAKSMDPVAHWGASYYSTTTMPGCASPAVELGCCRSGAAPERPLNSYGE